MISAALKSSAGDMALLERGIREEAALSTDESVHIFKINREDELENFLREKRDVEIVCVDVSLNGGIMAAERIRKAYPKTAIFLVAELNMSPVTYLKPQIMAAALAIKPLNENSIRNAVRQIFQTFIVSGNNEEVFIVEGREGRQRIFYDRILYFEARMKKIYLCTENMEHGFYDTMEHLEEVLADRFIRCHRSYIVNKKYIGNVFITKGIVVLKNGIEIPMSRSYKDALKKW